MALKLPAEILDHILSFLQADPLTLRECLRSHPLLSSFAEPHLYSHIYLMVFTIVPSPRSFCAWKFAELLSERPYIARYVRNLEIHVNGDEVYAQLWLDKISSILPKLLSLTRIMVSHLASPDFTWRAQPKCFRLAFWACLRLPSMREVYLSDIVDFPSISFLDNRYSSLSGLTLKFCYWRNSIPMAQEDDVDQAGSSHSNRSLPFEYLCLEYGHIDAFTDWSATCVLPLRSLKFCSREDHKSLTKLLTNSSTTLVNLDLDITLLWSYFYDFRIDPPTIQKPEIDLPAIFSMIPYLEELTLQSALDFRRCIRRGFGFHSGIPVIAKMFSIKPPSSLKCLTLYFDCPTSGLPDFRPPLSVSNVICMPLIELLSAVSVFSPSIQVNLFFNGDAFTSLISLTERPPLVSLLRDSEEIRSFFQH